MSDRILSTFVAALAISGLPACSPSAPTPSPKPIAAVPPRAAPPAVLPVAATAPDIRASATPVGQAIDAATPPPATVSPTPAAPPASSATSPAPASAVDPILARNRLIKVEVLLDRARFSPGEIDGRDGENLHRAIAAFETAHGMPATGVVDPGLWTALTSADANPVATDYVISADDVKGPFLGKVPTDLKAMARLPRMGFAGPLEGLAE